MRDKISKFLERACLVSGAVLIALGYYHGAWRQEWDRGTYDLLLGVIGVYHGGWRPESTVEVKVRAVIEGIKAKRGTS